MNNKNTRTQKKVVLVIEVAHSKRQILRLSFGRQMLELFGNLVPTSFLSSLLLECAGFITFPFFLNVCKCLYNAIVSKQPQKMGARKKRK